MKGATKYFWVTFGYTKTVPLLSYNRLAIIIIFFYAVTSSHLSCHVKQLLRTRSLSVA